MNCETLLKYVQIVLHYSMLSQLILVIVTIQYDIVHTCIYQIHTIGYIITHLVKTEIKQYNITARRIC